MTNIQNFVAGRSPAELYETYLVPGFFRPFAEQLADNAAPGQHCLDVACGTGVVSRALAERHANDLAVKAIDVAPPMINVAKTRSASPVIEYFLGSADALPFNDELFDAAFCQQGIQFFPDKQKAFEEIRRTLKRGGWLFASIWPPADQANPVFLSFEKAVGQHLGEELLPLGPFSFGEETRLRELAEDAGFSVKTLEKRTLPTVLPSVRELVLFDVLFLGRPGADGALQPVIAADDPASDDIVENMITDMTAELTDYIGADGRLVSSASTYFLAARK